MDSQKIHELAIAYAQVKLSEYQIKGKTVILEENTNFSVDEIQYFKSAYDFAIKHLSG